MRRKKSHFGNSLYNRALSGVIVGLPIFTMYSSSVNIKALLLGEGRNDENMRKSVVFKFFSKTWSSFVGYIMSFFAKKHAVFVYSNGSNSEIMHSEEIPEGQEGVFRLLLMELLFEDIGKITCIKDASKEEGRKYANKFDQQIEEAKGILLEVKKAYDERILVLSENFEDDELTKKYKEEFLSDLQIKEYDELTENVFPLSFLCAKAKALLEELKIKYSSMNRKDVFKNLAFLCMIFKEIEQRKGDFRSDVDALDVGNSSKFRGLYERVDARIESYLYVDFKNFLKKARISANFVNSFKSWANRCYSVASENIDLVFSPCNGQERGNFYEISKSVEPLYEGLVYAMGKIFFGCSEISIGYEGTASNSSQRRVRRIIEIGEKIASKTEEIEDVIRNKGPYLAKGPISETYKKIEKVFCGLRPTLSEELIVAEVNSALYDCFYLIASGNDNTKGFINECACSLLFIKYRDQLMKKINDYSINKNIKDKLINMCKGLLENFIFEQEREYSSHLFSGKAETLYKEFKKSKISANEGNKINLDNVFFIGNSEFIESDNLPSLQDINSNNGNIFILEKENRDEGYDKLENENRDEDYDLPSLDDIKKAKARKRYPVLNKENKNIFKFGQRGLEFIDIGKSINPEFEKNHYIEKNYFNDNDDNNFCLL